MGETKQVFSGGGAVRIVFEHTQEHASQWAAITRSPSSWSSERPDAVEPKHRLVAATLERRWNPTLGRVHELEERIAAQAVEAERQVTPDRLALLRLAEDFPRVWDHPSADIRTRKRVVRQLIEEIVVKVLPGAGEQIASSPSIGRAASTRSS